MGGIENARPLFPARAAAPTSNEADAERVRLAVFDNHQGRRGNIQ
jgi:hypothetical protein